MRKHAKMRVYTAMLIVMVCAVFVLHYSHWGKVRYRQSIARAGRGILPKKHHSKHKHRKNQVKGPGEKQHPLHPGPERQQHQVHATIEKQLQLHPGSEKQRHQVHPGQGVQQQPHSGNATAHVRHKKKGRHEGHGRDHPVLAPLPANNHVPPLGERGVKPPHVSVPRHQDNSWRLVAKGDPGKLSAQAGRRGHARTNHTEPYQHSSSNRTQGNVASPHLPINAPHGLKQNGVLAPRFRNRSASRTTTQAPKMGGSVLARVVGVKPRPHGAGGDRLREHPANNVVRMRQ